ncbi:hypothetical protein ACJMK2_008063 [Sinanodonta woodiana]|uniref:Uncharacterized protein n=1 Tax=Sinanodonta woodiana TaxID=1069815 RepID=A0ABD3VM06_SINWO
MEAMKCLCWFALLLVCAVDNMGAPINELENCWKLPGSIYKICLDVDSDSFPLEQFEMGNYLLLPSVTYLLKSSQSTSDSMKKMKLQHILHPWLKASSKVGEKEIMEAVSIDKRPFDSISYSTGFGTFK